MSQMLVMKTQQKNNLNFYKSVMQYKRNLISCSLMANDYNISVTAKQLKIHRNTLSRYIKLLDIPCSNSWREGKLYDRKLGNTSSKEGNVY